MMIEVYIIAVSLILYSCPRCCCIIGFDEWMERWEEYMQCLTIWILDCDSFTLTGIPRSCLGMRVDDLTLICAVEPRGNPFGCCT